MRIVVAGMSQDQFEIYKSNIAVVVCGQTAIRLKITEVQGTDFIAQDGCSSDTGVGQGYQRSGRGNSDLFRVCFEELQCGGRNAVLPMH